VRPASLFVLFATLIAAPSMTGAQLRPDAVRVGGYFAMGVAGVTDVTHGRRNTIESTGTFATPLAVPICCLTDQSWRYGPFWGGGVRVEVPLSRFVVLGGNVELHRQPIDLDPMFSDPSPASVPNQPPRRALTSHYDLWLKLVPYVAEHRRVPIELYVGIPLGFTLSTASYYFPPSRYVDPNAYVPDDLQYPFAREKWYGFDTGVLLGAQFLFQPRFAMTLEAGWRTIQAFNRWPSTAAWIAVRSASYYGALNVGTMFFF